MAYLTYVYDTNVNISSLDPINIVHEFADIFSNHLLGIKPECDTDFAIDIHLGTRLISISPYRTGPTQLRELSDYI